MNQISLLIWEIGIQEIQKYLACAKILQKKQSVFFYSSALAARYLELMPRYGPLNNIIIADHDLFSVAASRSLRVSNAELHRPSVIYN